MVIFFAAALVFRLAMLAVSIRHEKALKREGAVEIGAGNSKLLALTHTAFYFAALAEGLYRKPQFDRISLAGSVLYGFGILALLIVVRLLGRLWTVKLLLARDHELVVHPLFRAVRHPNYYLNLLPELLGFALIFHAYMTLVVGLALYAIPLSTRIRQEEAAMSERFASYKPDRPTTQ
jgi:isoprenylcysteine carboxyl methyltransferase (ICMT) family protein YpbQ